MPKITQQLPPRNSVATSRLKDVVSRIAPVTVTEGIKFNLYGHTKTGKTRLASKFPKPNLIIGTEDGTKSVSNVKGLNFVRIYSSGEFETLTDHLKSGKFKTACLDNGSGLQNVILKEVLGLEDVPVQKSWGMAKREHWQAVGAQWKERVSKFLNLADALGMYIIIIAHERNFGDDSELSSDIVFPRVGSALTPSAAGWLDGECDYICQTFIRPQELVKTVTIEGKQVEQRRKTSKKEFCLRTGPHEVYKTGFRVPEGTILPDLIVDPTFEKIDKLIHGKSL